MFVFFTNLAPIIHLGHPMPVLHNLLGFDAYQHIDTAQLLVWIKRDQVALALWHSKRNRRENECKEKLCLVQHDARVRVRHLVSTNA